MKTREWSLRILTIGFAVVLLGGCATTTPTSSYPAQSPPVVAPPALAENEANVLTVGPEDRYYILRVENNTPFTASFPRVHRVLDEKGFGQVRREREADFSLEIALNTEARDNPEARAQNTLGGAILGAATGAIIGAATGAPVTGTIAGAAGGGFLGMAAPAESPMVRIDLRIESFREGASSSSSVVVDMAHVPPYNVPRVIDAQISKMLQSLPPR